MHVLSLLFDPRGAIDRSTFWSGLAQLALVSLADLSRPGTPGPDRLSRRPAVVGDAYAIGILAGWLYGETRPISR
jgi:hypothetical protein